MKRAIAIGFAVLFIGFIVFRAMHNYSTRKAEQNRPIEEKIIPVSLTQPRTREIFETIHASGNLFALTEVALYSKVAGKVQKNLVEMGNPVKSGQTVCLILRDEIGYEFQPYEVKSDVKGVISKVLQNPGSTVNPNTPLMNLVDVDTVKAVAAVDELKIRFIRINQDSRVEVQAFPGESFRGRVSGISPVCNPINRTIDVEIRIPNMSGHLKPGMYAEAEFTRQKRIVMTLPVTAVIEKAGQKAGFVPRDHKAVLVPVVTGSVLEDEVEIVSGLKGGQSVVVSGASLLENGSRISIVGSEQGSNTQGDAKP